MSRAVIHVTIDENLLDRIEALVVKGDMSKSEIVRRTLGYGIKEMEKAIDRFTAALREEHRYSVQDDEPL